MKVLALDIGGANIKAAWGETGGGGVASVLAHTLPFALWKEPLQVSSATRHCRRGGQPTYKFVRLASPTTECYFRRKGGGTPRWASGRATTARHRRG